MRLHEEPTGSSTPSSEDRPRAARHHRLRVPASDRWVIWAILIVFTAIPLVSAMRVSAQGWRPTGDVATITLRSSDVGTADTPLIGQPTTTGAYAGGVESSHPGPIENYLLFVPVTVLGPIVGPVVGTGLLMSVTWGLILWLAHRRGGIVLLALFAAVLAAVAVGLGSQSLHDPLNSEISLYPYVLLVLATWSVVLGDTRILPLLVGVASFLAQVHVSGARLVLPIGLFVGAVLAIQLRHHPRRRRRAKRSLGWAAVVAAVLWLPVLIDQVSGSGNLTSLRRFVQTGPRGLGALAGLEHLVTAIGPPPVLARPGWLSFIQVLGPVQVVLAFAVLGLLGGFAVDRSLRGERRFPTLVLTLGVFAVSAVAYTASVPSTGAVRADAFRWMWVFGALVWVTLVWAIWLEVKPRLARKAVRVAPPAVAVIVTVVAMSSVIWTGLGHERQGPLMPVIAKVSAAVRGSTPPGEYRLVMDGSLWELETGLIVDLEDHGFHLRNDRGSRTMGEHRSIDEVPVDAPIGEIHIRASDVEPPPAGASLAATADVDPPGWPTQRYWVYVRSAP